MSRLVLEVIANKIGVNVSDYILDAWESGLNCYWNPLVHNCDALSLACDMGIDIETHNASNNAFPAKCVAARNGNIKEEIECVDVEDGVRRAIVGCAYRMCI